MNATQLIEAVAGEGCQLYTAEDGTLRGNKAISEQLMAVLKENKRLIIETLSRDRKAKEAGFIVCIHGTLYSQSVSQRSEVFIEQINGKWIAMRETFMKDRPHSFSHKKIYSNETFEVVILKAKNYFDYLSLKRTEKRSK